MLANMDAGKWDSVIAVNIAAQTMINAHLAEKGLFAEGAQVVSLASTSGIAGNRGQTNYATSKAGVIGLTAASAQDFASRGGAINAVAPGFIETDMTAKMPTLTRRSPAGSPAFSRAVSRSTSPRRSASSPRPAPAASTVRPCACADRNMVGA